MTVIVLTNAQAGTSGQPQEERESEIRQALSADGLSADVRSVPPRQLPDAARRALGERPDAVVAAGGDGTLSSIAGVLAGSGMPMGVLPLGTLNHFAKDLNIPTDLKQAAGIIRAGLVRDIDVAAVNGRIFINNSSIGIYPHVVRERDEQWQRLGRGKWPAMISAGIGVFRRHPMLGVRISTNTDSRASTTPFVFVGNNEYKLSLFSLGGRDRLDRGQLCLYIAHHTGRMGMLILALRALVGRLEQSRDFESLLVPEGWIESRRRSLLVSVDGEVAHMAPPLHYQILPKALRVLAPPAA